MQALHGKPLAEGLETAHQARRTRPGQSRPAPAPAIPVIDLSRTAHTRWRPPATVRLPRAEVQSGPAGPAAVETGQRPAGKRQVSRSRPAAETFISRISSGAITAFTPAKPVRQEIAGGIRGNQSNPEAKEVSHGPIEPKKPPEKPTGSPTAPAKRKAVAWRWRVSGNRRGWFGDGFLYSPCEPG